MQTITFFCFLPALLKTSDCEISFLVTSVVQTSRIHALFYGIRAIISTDNPSVETLVCLFLVRQPPVGQGLLIHEVSRSHTTTDHSQKDSSGPVITPTQRPLPDNKQHSQQTSMPRGRFQTRNLSMRAAADLRLRTRGYWDRQ
jgi:hypothetical protein